MVTRMLSSARLSVNLKDDAEKSMGSQGISHCSKDADLEGYLKAGKAIQALTGAYTAEIKKVSTYALISE